jgi:hypothetical protein
MVSPNASSLAIVAVGSGVSVGGTGVSVAGAEVSVGSTTTASSVAACVQLSSNSVAIKTIKKTVNIFLNIDYLLITNHSKNYGAIIHRNPKV